MTKELVEEWASQFERTVSLGDDKPLSTDDERLVQLFESFQSLISKSEVDRHYQAYLNGNDSLISKGIAFLRDAYELRDYGPQMRYAAKSRGQEPTADNRLLLARKVWRSGDVRQVIVDAVRLALLHQTGPRNWLSDDFRTLYWRGSSYSLTTTQGSIVSLLVSAFERKSPEVPTETIQSKVGCGDVRDVFRERDPDRPGKKRVCSVWNEVIVKGIRKDTIRMIDPK